MAVDLTAGRLGAPPLLIAQAVGLTDVTLYAGRAGTGITDKELKRLAGVLKPLQVPKMPLASRRRVTAASARRFNFPRCTGYAPMWLSR